MAPFPDSPSSPLKRSSSQTMEGDEQPPKRLKRPYKRTHIFQQYQKDDFGQESTFFDTSIIASMLTRSISLVLKHDGYEMADPVALEDFRAFVEEYILHFCLDIHRSMLASRRIQPIPQDFEFALQSNNITLDSLLPHLKPPIDASISHPPLPTPPPDQALPSSFRFLGPELSGAGKAPAYVPSTFPALPSQHTYRSSPVFTQRDQDPRKLRERATEDGRFGEEALRKVVAAAKAEDRISDKQKGRGRANEDTMDSIWGKTLQDMLQGSVALASNSVQPGDGDIVMGGLSDTSVPARKKHELAPVVNCERIYWRKKARAGGQKATKNPPVVEPQGALVVDR